MQCTIQCILIACMIHKCAVHRTRWPSCDGWPRTINFFLKCRWGMLSNIYLSRRVPLAMQMIHCTVPCMHTSIACTVKNLFETNRMCCYIYIYIYEHVFSIMHTIYWIVQCIARCIHHMMNSHAWPISFLEVGGGYLGAYPLRCMMHQTMQCIVCIIIVQRTIMCSQMQARAMQCMPLRMMFRNIAKPCNKKPEAFSKKSWIEPTILLLTWP